MRPTLRIKWFVWLIITVAIFLVLQLLTMIGIEIHEVTSREETLWNALPEMLSMSVVSIGIFFIMMGILWVISKRMIKPLKNIADIAEKISKGSLTERIKGDFADDEIGSLVSALNLAFDNYNNIVEKLKSFTANASHQLRTPLSTIRNIGEVCLQNPRKQEEYIDTIANILEEAQRLSLITERLLLLARLEASEGERSFTRIGIAQITGNVMESYAPLAEQRGIRLTCMPQDEVYIQGDPILIQQMILNLVDNAVKYCSKGDSISIDLSVESEAAVLKISDTGPGIPDAMTADIFDRFSSLPLNASAENRGSGLGLAIVAEIARTHHGTVKASRNHDRGMTFTLSIPLPKAQKDH